MAMASISPHGSPQGRIMHFPTPVKFSRWLFKQHRGGDAGWAWATLVTGIREAKPCVEALAAAQTGDCSRLRPDLRRLSLRRPWGSNGGIPDIVTIAVDSMIVIAPTVQQEARIKRWVGTKAVGQIQINVVANPVALHFCLRQIPRFDHGLHGPGEGGYLSNQSETEAFAAEMDDEPPQPQQMALQLPARGLALARLDGNASKEFDSSDDEKPPRRMHRLESPGRSGGFRCRTPSPERTYTALPTPAMNQYPGAAPPQRILDADAVQLA